MRIPALIFLFFVTLLPQAFGERIEKKGGISFVNLAPGEVERDLIKTLPVRIAFASESSIPYAGVYVRIFNESGITIFKHLCEKPWLFLKLPQGEYHVAGVDRKKMTRIKSFKVKKEGKGPTFVTLKWPREEVGY
jgi:hypothetical protein